MAFKSLWLNGSQGRSEGSTCSVRAYDEVEVEVPENFLGDVMGDLNSRRGQIEGMGSEQGIVSDSQSSLAKCLAMLRISALRLKAGESSQWSLATTKKYLATWLEAIITKSKGNA